MFLLKKSVREDFFQVHWLKQQGSLDWFKGKITGKPHI